MKSELYLSFATSSSRHSLTYAPRWRRPRLRAVHVATGSPGCACVVNLRQAQETLRGPNHNPPCRIPASAQRLRAAKTHIPHRHQLLRQPHVQDPLKMNSGLYSMSSREKEYGYATKLNSCAASSTTGTRRTPWRSRSRERSMTRRAPTAPTPGGCAPSGTRCCSARRSWRRRRRRPPSPRPRPRPARRSAASTQHWKHPRAHRASLRLTPRSSRRFSSRAILSNFRGSYSLPPFKIRYLRK